MRLRQEKKLDRNEMIQLLETANREDREYLAAQAREVREKIYGKEISAAMIVITAGYVKVTKKWSDTA